jgi:hypothetical protein
VSVFSTAEEDDDEPAVTELAQTGTVLSVSAAVQAFIAAQGGAPLGERDGFRRQFEFEERFIEVGAPMLVVTHKPPACVAPTLAGHTPVSRPPGDAPKLLARTSKSVRQIRDRWQILAVKSVFFLLTIGWVLPMLWATIFDDQH